MAVWFEKLVSQGVLIVGKHAFMSLYHLGCLHPENASHRGTDVKHFERYACFQIAIPPTTWCLGFHVLWGPSKTPGCNRCLRIPSTWWPSLVVTNRSKFSCWEVGCPNSSSPPSWPPHAHFIWGGDEVRGTPYRISCRRSHLRGGEEYKNDKPLQRLIFSRSNEALLQIPSYNSVT